MAEPDEESGSRCGASGKSAAEIRKINKPLMEKKRRERINNCLNQLKMFLMDATKKDSSYYSKLEKADILEMSVKYLKNLQRQHLAVAMATDPKVISKYATGYSQCATEVTRYLAKLEGLDQDVKSRLSSHLTNCVHKLNTAAVTQNQAPVTSFPVTGSTQHAPIAVSLAPSTGIVTQQQIDFTLGGDNANFLNLNDIHVQSQLLQNQNQPKQTVTNQMSQNQGGSVTGLPVLPVQLIPAKLPTGDVVLLLTNNQNTVNQAQTPNNVNHVITSSSFQINQGAALPMTSTTSTVTSESTKVMSPIVVTSLPQQSSNLVPAKSTSVASAVPDSSTSPKDKVTPRTSQLMTSQMTSQNLKTSQMTSQNLKTSQMTSQLPLNVMSQSESYSNLLNSSSLIPPYPVPAFQGFHGLPKTPLNISPGSKPLKIEPTPLLLNKPGPSFAYPNPPSPSEALDLSDPNRDLNNNYNDMPNRNEVVFVPGNPDNDPMWRPW